MPLADTIEKAKAAWRGEIGEKQKSSFKREAVQEMSRLEKNDKTFKASALSSEVAAVRKKADDARAERDELIKVMNEYEDKLAEYDLRIYKAGEVEATLKKIIADQMKKQIELRLKYDLKPTAKSKSVEETAIGVSGEGRRHKHRRRHGGCESCGGNDRFD